MPRDVAPPPPAYQRYARDEIAETIGLSLEERGAYWLLKDICWLEGMIPAAIDQLARLCGVSPAKMRRLWPAIAPRFQRHPVREGMLWHHPLEEYRRSLAEFKKERSEAGKKGAKSRWQRQGSANGSAMAQLQAQPMANGSSAPASASAPNSNSGAVPSEPGRPDSRSPFAQVMPVVRELLWLGEDPPREEQDRDGDVLREMLRGGRSADEVEAAVRGFALLRDAGKLPWPQGTRLTLRALNKPIADKNAFNLALDAYYADQPTTSAGRGGVVSLMAYLTPQAGRQ